MSVVVATNSTVVVLVLLGATSASAKVGHRSNSNPWSMPSKATQYQWHCCHNTNGRGSQYQYRSNITPQKIYYQYHWSQHTKDHQLTCSFYLWHLQVKEPGNDFKLINMGYDKKNYLLREEEGTIVMTNSKMLSRKVGKKSATGCAPYICSLLWFPQTFLLLRLTRSAPPDPLLTLA